MLPSIHTEITREALSDKFSKSAIDFVCEANEESDDFRNLFIDEQHFDDDKLGCGVLFIRRLENAIIAQLLLVPDCSDCRIKEEKEGCVKADCRIKEEKERCLKEREERYITALYALGRLLHAIQDFYSHSNWIHLPLNNRPIIWKENPYLINLKTCYFDFLQQLFVAPTVNLFERRKRKLSEKREFQEKFPTKVKMYHWALNKDENRTLADLVFRNLEGGRSGYKLARENAISHSRDKWSQIEDELKNSVRRCHAEIILQGLKCFKLTFYKTNKDALRLGRVRNEGVLSLHRATSRDFSTADRR